MQALPADLNLSFETGKIVVSELLKVRVFARYNKALDSLRKQELMVKRDECALVLE